MEHKVFPLFLFNHVVLGKDYLHSLSFAKGLANALWLTFVLRTALKECIQLTWTHGELILIYVSFILALFHQIQCIAITDYYRTVANTGSLSEPAQVTCWTLLYSQIKYCYQTVLKMKNPQPKTGNEFYIQECQKQLKRN